MTGLAHADLAAAVAGTVTPGSQNLDPSAIGPGLAGFLVVFGLALATLVLIRSMVGHLRKVRYSPEPGADAPGPQRPPDPRDPSG